MSDRRPYEPPGESRDDPQDEPRIISAEVGPSHDGEAEAVFGIRYPNGAIRHVTLGPESIAPVLEAQRATTLTELIGRPWSVLVGAPHE